MSLLKWIPNRVSLLAIAKDFVCKNLKGVIISFVSLIVF